MKSPSVETLNQFLHSRTSNEKMLLVVFAALFVFGVDYFLWLRPVGAVFAETGPQLKSLKIELETLRDDKKNAAIIEKNWSELKGRLVEAEKRFIAPSEIPSLLEQLSVMARDSGVRLISLKPVAAEGTGYYSRVPIRIQALAGTHAFGRFLEKLETSTTLFRIQDLRIAGNADEQRHVIDLSLEAYGKGA